MGLEMRNKLTMIVIVILSLSVFGMAKADELPFSVDETYQKAIVSLMDMGAIPTFRDKELLMIKSDPLPMKLTTEEADCGSMFGIPYLKDKRVKTALTYQIRIKKIDENKSEIEVKITIDGYMDVNEGAPFFIEKTRNTNKVLTCNSKGLLESKFINSLKE
jgi:hypothetical protein